jgi:isopenicillin-N epimerase
MHKVYDWLAESRAALAHYLNVLPDDLVYFQNPTAALNMAIRSLAGEECSPYRLHPGDEILTTDHEYGSLNRTWEFVCARTGAKYVQRHMPLPMTTHADFVERFWAGVTPRTRVIYISHITSPTGLIFPVEEICRRARAAGLLTIIDGAHAPSNIPLDLTAVGADVYSGACHKWLCSPKGAAFLHVRREIQGWLEPLIIGWAWTPEPPGQAKYVEPNEAQGTRDASAYLAVPAAIEFQEQHDWTSVRAHCRDLLSSTIRRICDLTGLEPYCPDSPEWYSQLAIAPLPKVDLSALRSRLYEECHVEVPISQWQDHPLARISIQGYTTQEDVDALVEGLRTLLPQMSLAQD